MKIKQVEELVGITRKNIRFYEDQGLLNVERAETDTGNIIRRMLSGFRRLNYSARWTFP